MNRHWMTLEYPEILKRLAEHTDFSGGRTLAMTLEPVFEIHAAQALLNLTQEACSFLLARPDFVLGGVRDIRAFAEQALHGVTLQPSDLIQVRDTLLSAARIRRLLTRLDLQFPALADIAWRVEVIPTLADAIAQVLDDRGEVRDNASPALSRIRRDLRVSQDRVQDRLRRLMSSPQVAPYLQDALITRREGRFVIPVRTDLKGHVAGIVHDRSSSGVTLFIEPTQVVELNNALRELRLAETEEILRLLRELTGKIGDVADEIMVSMDALSELDLTFAKARYAESLQATLPELLPIPSKFSPVPAAEVATQNMHPGSVIRLRGARHPLLDPETVVAVNVDLDADTHVLIITGPNTGGKTVSLKTVGLLTLMTQAGMLIPVDAGSQLSCFDAVYADIGDEQSIEQSLSTFSSHLTNIITFLKVVRYHDLVLLDELGAGTDPAEGAALARSLLDALRASRCTVLVATHYPELKLYGHNTPGVRNASMEFDVVTLSPTYRLMIGLPGRSNAFAIARRLGVPERIVKQAQGMIDGETLRAEDMLQDLHSLRLQAVGSRDAARLAKLEAEALAVTLRERLVDIETERREILRQAEDEAHREVDALRAQLRTLRKKMLATPLREAPPALEALEADLEGLETQIAEPEPLLDDLMLETEALDLDPDIYAGDTVRLRSLGIQGVVLSLDGDDALVQAGSMRTRVALDSLELLHHHAPAVVEPVEVSTPVRGPSPGMQLDLRGQTVEEALDLLDRYLDNASLAALPWVRIVHGKGTGKLRREVRKFMGTHPLVSSYESAADNEGGSGATVAHLVSGV